MQNSVSSATPKIGDDWAIFVQSKWANAEHTLAYVSILLSADLCKKSQSERFFPTLKSEMIELFFRQARRRKRSIVDLCEHFGYRWLVEKEPIRTIFTCRFSLLYPFRASHRLPWGTRACRMTYDLAQDLLQSLRVLYRWGRVANRQWSNPYPGVSAKVC